MGLEKNNLQNSYASTRLLLALWDLGETQQEVGKGKLSDRMKSKGKNIAGYPDILDKLQQQGAIAASNKGKAYTLTSPTGLEVLGEGLRSGEFKFEEGKTVGTWVTNALLKWINQIDVPIASTPALVNGKGTNIVSYEEFKSVVLEVYDKLNYEYNFNHLVPIYRIRRAIGDRVSRTEFNNWLLETQADDILQLQGGTVEDNARDKIEDSITTALNGLRCYAKRLKP
jgi:hypothetical protein